MMSEQDVVKNILTKLRESVQKKDLSKCLEHVGIIGEYFDGTLNTSQINYTIELLLKWDDQKISILRFLAKSLSYSKSAKFSEVNKYVFELLQLLIRDYPSQVKLFSKDVVGACVIYTKSNIVTAYEKECAVQTIHKMIPKNVLSDEVDIIKLIDDVMSVFTQKSPTKRLQQHIYELLGILSVKYPDKFSPNKAVELRQKMMATIQSLFKDDKATQSLSLTSGAVEGLNNHLVNFTPSIDEDPSFSDQLYKCMVQLTDPDKWPSGASSNRVAFRNMLQTVEKYGSLNNIPALMFRDYKFWQKLFLKWINSKTYDDKSCGVRAMQSFHKQVASVLEKCNGRDDDKKVLMFFMNFFQETLESPKSQPHEIRIAIRGFGSMATACKLLLEPKYLSERFDLVMQRTEYSYHTKDRMKRREVLEHLPNFVEALSRIMNQLDEISGMQLQSLESIIVILIKDFHFLSTTHQSLVAVSLLETFINLQKLGGKLFENLLESVIWKGILWTCSHQLLYDMRENLDNVEDWKETITYKQYLPLWKRLLEPDDEKYSGISKLIYNHFIEDCFLIIEKLDLSTQKRKFYDASMDVDREFFFSDPSLDLEPVRAENFQILYNLVQFYSDVVSDQSVECLRSNFIEWLELWLEKSIQLSMKHPLISGFLQLIEISLKVMDRLDYAIDTENPEVTRVIAPLNFCIKSMLLVRCQQMSGELQVACLLLIFQVPITILQEYDDEMTSVFIIGFAVGRSLLSVAHHALTCFERIIDSLSKSPKERRRLLTQVLPSLETFLSSRDSNDNEKKHFSRVKKQRLAITTAETDLMRFKKRVFQFLGNFDPDEAQLVLSNFDQKLVRDHITEIFEIKLECSEKVVPLICLDNSVERILQLAVSSSERSTKISACELIHGLVVYMMGKNLDGAETLPLWRDLCDNLIVLGADKDQTVRQLFEPLLMQMMHFYSQPKNILSPMTTTLIESLLAMICFQGNNSVQDLSARLLREFILWLNKNSDRNQRKASPVKLVDLFQEMKKMSLETSSSRRMGATLAFNNIYRIIREDESLIDVYWLYLLDVFSTNFKSSEDFSFELEINFIDGRQFEQVSSTLDHLTRVFVERSDIFHRSNSDRILPVGFEGISLLDVLKWLFNESGQLQYHYRQKCMEIFMKILPECGTVEDICEHNFSVDKVLEVGEVNGIAHHPNLEYLKESTEPIFKEVYKWMQSLLKSVDFYIWIFENQIISKTKHQEFLQRSVVLATMSFFLESIVNKNMVDLLRSINENLFNRSQMSFEAKMGNRNLDNIDTIRCIILVRIIDFLTILIRENLVEQFLDDNREALVKITKTLIFKPQYLGFDYKSKNSLLKLSIRLTNFVKSVHLEAPVEFKKPLITSLRKKLIKKLNYFCENCDQLMSEKTVSILNTNRLKGIELIIIDLKELLEMDILEQKLIVQTAEVLLKKIFNGITEVTSEIQRPRYMTNSAKMFATRIVQICLKIDVFLKPIVCFSFNDNNLQISISSFIRHGEHFMQIFKKPIFELFTSMLLETIQLLVAEMKETGDSNKLRIISVLAELNEHIFTYHKDNKELLDENISTMISQWPTIIRIAFEMENELNCVDLAIINLVTHLAMTSPIELVELGRRLENFQLWLMTFLENSKNSLELKSKAVFLLPCITDSNDRSNEKLMKVLNSIQEKHMPLKSHEFPDGSLKRVGLIAITEALFVALLRSRSPVIYRFIINATISDDDYILESKLQQVQMELMESLSPSEQEFLLNQTFDAFSTGGFEPEFRMKFISRFLMTIMKTCRVDVMMNFIRQKMDVIWNLTEASLNDDSENALVNRCGGYMVIEAFVARVPKEKIESGSYSYAGRSNTGVNMVKDFIKKMNLVRRDLVFVVDDPARQNLLRIFHCHCYRALAAMVSNIKDNPELYNVTLFKEDSNSNTFIWRKLINVTNDELYSNWSQDFNELPRMKDYIVSVKDLQGSKESTAHRKYIETVSIFDRSLSQSLTKTDLSYSVVLSSREALEREQERRELEQQKAMKIELESTPINDHEVMSVLVGVVRHIHVKKISPFIDLERQERKKYEWVLSIAGSMKNPGNHKNVRIFLAKLVDNCRDIFVHYAKQLLGAVLSVIVDGCLGEKMNFFITDLVAMLLSWNHVYKPSEMSEKQDACALLKFLIENANNEQDVIFKLNLELIKKMVETWKEVLAHKIPTQTMLDLLEKPIDQQMHQQLRCGIQLNAVLLANDLEPWMNLEQCNLFIKTIVACFSNPNARVYQAAAQLLGMCLHKRFESIDIVKGDENFLVIDKISQTLSRIRTNTNDVNIFLQLLYGIQKSFPRILDQFMTLIKFNIPKAIGKIKCIYLEMFLSRLEVEVENLYSVLVTIGVKNLLKQNEYQMLALHIINKSLEHLNAENTQSLVDELILLASSSRVEVRQMLIEIMIFVAKKYRDDETFDKKKPMRIILKSFTDSDTQIQNRAGSYFSSEGGLSKSFFKRFEELLRNYYDPTLEKEFLHYATQLLLDISIREPRSRIPLLNYDSTKDREFFEYPIMTKSNTQRSLPPMFIQSQQKQLLTGDGSMYDQLVRATQMNDDNRLFTPTQDPIKITQVSQTFSFKETQNSLVFSIKPQFLDKRSNSFKPAELDEFDIEAQIARKKERTKPEAWDYLRKRIVRNVDQEKKDYALRATDKRDFMNAKREEMKKQSREGREVVLYRRYRLGDLPDFFFNSLALLMPLQALAKKDVAVARDVFISIFQSIVDLLSQSDDAEKLFFVSINEAIMSILQQTRNTDTFFMGTLIEMAMKSKKYLEISPSVLANVSIMNNMMVTGALFLECQLNHLLIEKENQEEEPIAKRKKLDSEANSKLHHWSKLIELYYKMNEYEVVLGLFTEKLNLVPEIKTKLATAIEFESGGRFLEASSIYQDLIGKNEARNQNEKEFYYNSFFHCLENLSDWREITKEIKQQFDSYNDVWDEEIPFHKETLLPHLLKSELRMILNENANDEFLNILEDWMNNKEKCEYLRAVFPEEIVMLHILEEKFAEGCVEAETALRHYADEWSCFEMQDEKLKCLKSVRNIAELNNFIYLMRSTKTENNLKKMYLNWKLSHPKPSDSIVHWGDLVAYRQNFFNLIQQNQRFPQNDDETSLLTDIKQKIFNVAFAQKNCDAARFMINGLKDDIRSHPSEEKVNKCNLAIGKYNIMIVEQKLTSPDEMISKLCSGLRKLVDGVIKKASSKEHPSLYTESLCCTSEISWKLWSILEKCQADNVEVSEDFLHLISQRIEAPDGSFDVAQHLLKFSENSLKEARKSAQKYLDKNYSAESEALLATVYLKMGQFYHQVYGSGAVTSQEIQWKMIQSIFRAIAHGSTEAKIYIPYILQLSDLKNNQLTSQFNVELNMVPLYMFIPYISQMLSSYDFEEVCYLDELLLKVAAKYPRAVFFPFKLSRTNYQQTTENRGMEKEHTKKIDDAVSSPVMNQFVNALQCLVVPEKLLFTHFNSFKHFMDSNRKTMTDEKFKEAIKKLGDEVFMNNRKMKGSSFATIKNFKIKFQQLEKMSWKSEKIVIKEKIRSLYSDVGLISKRRYQTFELHKLCNWLAEYKWCGDKDIIEIPGQYFGDHKPFVEQHVKIVRFEQRLKVFSSNQLPIEIKMYGSDGKTYSFIIKYGEDLRQDQRIQQAFEFMSKELANDKNCKQNRLRIETYQVIPINSNCGLLSVVKDAQTISEFLQKASQQSMNTSFNDFISEIRHQFRLFLLDEDFFVDFERTYSNAVLTKTSKQFVDELLAKEAKVPKDIISVALMKSAVSLETFYILRKNFITSLATMSIAHWLLGIGDRHLNNILIDIKSGRLIGIDFGIAFGAAANIPVPETVPFRLTSHFVNVVAPLGVDGMIKKNMVHVLRCLRTFSEKILICLEMFVNEPTMDWLIRAKLMNVDANDSRETDNSWNPKARIAIVKRKIKGANPVKICHDELSISQIASKPELLARYKVLTEGEGDSERKKMAKEDLNVEDQVTCLIEMATDKTLLAITYLGWDPWI